MLASNRLPFYDWLTRVRNAEAINPNLSEFLKEHFVHMSGGGIVLDTHFSRSVSSTLKSSGAVSRDTINLYIDYWRSINYVT